MVGLSAQKKVAALNENSVNMSEQADNGIPTKFASLFRAEDDSQFMHVVSSYLEKDGHRLRQMSAAAYVERCRNLWQECELDEVFSVKILLDVLVQKSEPERKFPWSGLEVVEDTPITEEDLYCVAIGLVNEAGEFIGAPPGYDPSPKNPQSKRGVIVAGTSDLPADEPDQAQPELYIIAMLDVLGFKRKLTVLRLDGIQQLYDRLIKVAVAGNVAQNLWTPGLASVGKNLFSPSLFWLPMRYAYFSDTLLFWIVYHPVFIAPFLERCCGIFCEALRLGLPLRGSVTLGRCVLHKKSSTYLGDALVEAVELEKSQEWVGVTLGASLRRVRFPFLRSQEPMVIPGEPPLKKPPGEKPDKYDKLISGLVLDWPRYWRANHEGQPSSRLRELATADFANKYENAIRFAEHSLQHAGWFLVPNPKPVVFKG